MYVYVYIYMCLCMYIYIYTCIYIIYLMYRHYIYTYICIHVYITWICSLSKRQATLRTCAKPWLQPFARSHPSYGHDLMVQGDTP